MIGQETVTETPAAPSAAADTKPAVNSPFTLNRMALAMVPFTPVAFAGPDSIYAWARLGLYGTAAALTWQKQRQASYVLMGAAGLCLVTSLAGNAWGNAV